jgi:hypothetical protein
LLYRDSSVLQSLLPFLAIPVTPGSAAFSTSCPPQCTPWYEVVLPLVLGILFLAALGYCAVRYQSRSTSRRRDSRTALAHRPLVEGGHEGHGIEMQQGRATSSSLSEDRGSHEPARSRSMSPATRPQHPNSSRPRHSGGALMSPDGDESLHLVLSSEPDATGALELHKDTDQQRH